MPRVTFQPSGNAVDVPEAASLLEAACAAGVTDVLCCGITPACGQCRALILDGDAGLTPPDALEMSGRARLRFLPGERFGCMAHVFGNVEVELRT